DGEPPLFAPRTSPTRDLVLSARPGGEPPRSLPPGGLARLPRIRHRIRRPAGIAREVTPARADRVVTDVRRLPPAAPRSAVRRAAFARPGRARGRTSSPPRRTAGNARQRRGGPSPVARARGRPAPAGPRSPARPKDRARPDRCAGRRPRPARRAGRAQP